jgi:membrane-bound metal-dependent hydrolase YbcI (DUF457 family)
VKEKKSTWKFIAVGAIGGAFPDIDAISLWSKFDSTIGHWLHLHHTGEEIYCGKMWYSHHGFFHSLVAMFFLASLFIMVPWFKSTFIKTKESNHHANWFFLIFFLSGTMHILEDMPTPDNIWGGVRIFWPFEMYIGGWNYIWWWNNYDLFLIIFSVALLNGSICFIPEKFGAPKKYIALTFLSLGVISFCWQIHKRPDFIKDSKSPMYQKNEEASKNIQKETLPSYLYGPMEIMDQTLPIYF